jgi:ribosome assembly protein YihI (activator of Der GTPase)
MTKARARERAKAKAGKKAKKRAAGGEQTDQNLKTGHFDPGAGSIKSPTMQAGGGNFGGGPRRGASRSK